MTYKVDNSETITDGQVNVSAVVGDLPQFDAQGVRLNTPDSGWTLREQASRFNVFILYSSLYLFSD